MHDILASSYSQLYTFYNITNPRPIPWKKFMEPGDEMIVDAREDVREIGFRMEA